MKITTIGITGGSGSGKTTFIEHLRQSFSERDLCIISQDDYYRPRAQQSIDREGVKNFDRPTSIDKKAFAKDIKRLLSGTTVERLEYTFNNASKTPKMLVFRPAPILIVEGIFVFHYKKIRKLLDLKVFLHAKENLKVIRRIKRDRLERNYPLDDVLYRYENHVLPTFEKYILPYKEDADVVINNNKDFSNGLVMLEGYIAHQLRQRQ
ncbi:MAG: P-loop NTPase fold protein [Bacteroidota bacterium]